MNTPDFLQMFLAHESLDGLIIQRHANFAWLTGGRSFIGTGSEFGDALLVVIPQETIVVTSNIEAERLQAEEISPDWRVVSYPWWAEGEPARTVQQLVGGAALGADGPFPGARDVSDALTPLRWTLSPKQREVARQLGREVGEALEESCRAFAPGETEFAVAARLGAALITRGIDPIVRLVAADERIRQWRHPLPTNAPVQRYAMVVACGQRSGLIISATRLVHFGPVPADLAHRQQACAKVDAAMIRATVPGAAIKDVFAAAEIAYAGAGFPGEWQYHHQGGLAGYAAREYKGTPTSPYTVEPWQLFAWNPTIAGAKSEDTFLTTPDGPEIITATGNWPQIQVDGLARPDILVR